MTRVSYKYVEKHVLNELKSAEELKQEFIVGKESFTKGVRDLIDEAELLILEGEEEYNDSIQQAEVAIGYYRGLLDMMAKKTETPGQFNSKMAKKLVSLSSRFEKIESDLKSLFRPAPAEDVVKRTIVKKDTRNVANVSHKEEVKQRPTKEDIARQLFLDTPIMEEYKFITPDGKFKLKTIADYLLTYAAEKGVVTLDELEEYGQKVIPGLNKKAITNIIQLYFKKMPGFATVRQGVYKFNK